MSGQFQRPNLSGSFLDQASCNRAYSSLPTSSVTPTVSSTYPPTWPNLANTDEASDSGNTSFDPESNALEPEALMKLLNEGDDQSTRFFNHPPETATTPTFCNQITSTFKGEVNSARNIALNSSEASTNNLASSRTSQNKQIVTSHHSGSIFSNSSSKSDTTKNSSSKLDNTFSTSSYSTVSSSEVNSVSDSNASHMKSPNSSVDASKVSNGDSSSPGINNAALARGQTKELLSNKMMVSIKENVCNKDVNSPSLNKSQSVTNSCKLDLNGAHTPKGTQKSDVPPTPDNVESLLESMFQITPEPKSSAPSSSKPLVSPQKNRALRAESVEKILKSPSPPSFNGDCNLDVLTKDIKQEPNEEVSAQNFQLSRMENKENTNVARMNGQAASPTDKPIKIFNEVESELEKMFAGLVEPETSNVKTELSSAKFDENSRQIKNIRRASDNSILSSCSSTENKKFKKDKKRIVDERKDNKFLSKKFKFDKDASNDSFYSKLRGPVIHVDGSKDNPTGYTIINCRTKSEDEDASDSKFSHSKKKSNQRINSSKAKFAGSNSFGAEGNLDVIRSTDETWVCLFCKKGPHVAGVGGDPSGDLFGPYFIKDKDAANSSDQKVKKKKKSMDSKPSFPPSEGLLSIPNSTEYEVWVHENCCVWASGVYLVGTKLQGLEDAVWQAFNTKCSHCGGMGASIGCVTRHCPGRVHYSCAIHSGWHLDSETFITKCGQHEKAFTFTQVASSS